MASLSGKKVVVYGLGKSGVAAARLLEREGALVTGLDKSADAGQGLSISLQVGDQFDAAVLGVADLVVVSPGVPLSLPELVDAQQAGVELIGEVELAARYLTCPLVGITGTNGKSTTTALCGQLFKSGGQRVFVGGNLGTPLSEAVLSGQALDFAIVELSSFQLEGIRALHLRAAAILNLTPDHLDRYANAQEYGAAKRRIFLNHRSGDFGVVNADDAAVVALSDGLHMPVYGFTRKTLPSRFPGGAHATSVGFSLSLGGTRESYRVTARTLRGAHNRENAMAAALLARGCGVSASAVQEGLDIYPGLPHRLEFVRTLEGVDYINDSKATNVDSAVVALRALEQPIWLIAGGKGKGAPYAPMVDAAQGRLRGVLTIGADAPHVEAAFRGVAPVHPCETLERAVAKGRALARAGEVVLLAPACASYDQFRNFEDRGDRFKRLVEAL